MSLLLSAQTGEVVTAAQLLGEEAADLESRAVEGEKAVGAMLKKMKKAGI